MIVPLILGAAAIWTGVTGVKKGGVGLASMQQARAIADAAGQEHRCTLTYLEETRVVVGSDVCTLNTLREQVSRTTLSRMVALLTNLERRGRLRGPHLLSLVPADP